MDFGAQEISSYFARFIFIGLVIAVVTLIILTQNFCI